MPRYTTSQTYTDGNTQIVALPEGGPGGGGVVAVGGGGGGTGGEIVEYRGGEGAVRPREDEDLEVKLRRISEQVPVRISNTSGSSAGSGSGDFHQVTHECCATLVSELDRSCFPFTYRGHVL